jgi:hypothetical protein
MSEIQLSLAEAEAVLQHALLNKNLSDAAFMAKTAIWLQACGYPGLTILQEALTEVPPPFAVARSSIGLDLKSISCVHIGQQIISDVRNNGRVYLRNVRHGLFLLPASVEFQFGIGCPIDAGFAIGGERTKNPYVEKLEMAETKGLVLDVISWQNLIGQK